MKNVLVVPSIREHSIHQFLNKWLQHHWDLVIVVEDNPTRTFKLEHYNTLSHEVQHVSWAEIDADLGDNAWIISRRDSAIRSYGFLLAHRLGAEKIFTLDDDCEPIGNGFVVDHAMNLYHTPKWVSSVPGHRTRGLPYHNTGKANRVMMSVGLWEGVPDYDAIQTLGEYPPIKQLPETRVMPLGQYFPICGMNLCFRREIAPLTYFPLMGEGHPYRRFDDIWFGIICKKVCDHLGYMITCGKPYIHHTKASDPFVNLVKEAPGVKANEHFWEVIDAIPLTGQDPVTCMGEIGYGLSHFEKDAYLNKLGEAVYIWASLF
jgi:reversibly glycosylated polypeptide/UDP-arabinopyranose mutase